MAIFPEMFNSIPYADPVIITTGAFNKKTATDFLIDNTLDYIRELRESSSEINYLISRLQTTSNNGVAIFGGAVRDWFIGKEPKDIDIVIDTNYFKEALEGISYDKTHPHNKLGGNVFVLDGVSFDVWNLVDTYAFKSGQFEPSWSNLVRSVPFNLDSVLVMLSGEVYEHRFWEGINSKTIDIVNKVNQDEKFIAQRAILFAEKYQYKLSSELDRYVKKHLGTSSNSEVVIEISKRSSNSLNSIPELDI